MIYEYQVSANLLLAALLSLTLLVLLLCGHRFNHFLFLVDPVPPVLLTTLLQQGHSETGQHIWHINLNESVGVCLYHI